jgi:hypothetical protein
VLLSPAGSIHIDTAKSWWNARCGRISQALPANSAAPSRTATFPTASTLCSLREWSARSCSNGK